MQQVHWDVRWKRAFRRHGFRGLVALGDAVAERERFLDEHHEDLVASGVYAIFAPLEWEAGWRTGRLPNVITPWTKALLEARWVEGVELVYIGCAGRTKASRSLGKRISDLLKHGSGKVSVSGPHKGGERVWQCAGWEDFELAWKPTGPFPEPHDHEVAIGLRFAELTGRLPFANERL